MANNRMILVCNVCVPDDDFTYRDNGVLAIAKWYPGSAYYYAGDLLKWAEVFFNFLIKHQHKELPSQNYLEGATQDNPVRLVYESISLPVLHKEEVLD